MGAYLGRGHGFPCETSFALGQTTICQDDRVVWGTLHRTLGLSGDAYLLAHVLESWTPWVVLHALDRTLGPARGPSHLGALIALAWISFAIAIAIGVLVARTIRSRSTWPPLLRGLIGAGALWCALAFGGWRALWWLVPTQRTDPAVVTCTLTIALTLTALTRRLRPRARLGLFFGAMSALIVAYGLFLMYRGRAMGGLMMLLVAMPLPLVPWVWLWHRLSRVHHDELESAAFTALLLSLFVALLLPAF